MKLPVARTKTYVTHFSIELVEPIVCVLGTAGHDFVGCVTNAAELYGGYSTHYEKPFQFYYFRVEHFRAVIRGTDNVHAPEISKTFYGRFFLNPFYSFAKYGWQNECI